MSAVPTEPQTRIASSVPRTLLLTGTRPTPDGVGGIILDELCGFLPKQSLCVAYVADARGETSDSSLRQGAAMRTIPVIYRRRPESRFGRIGRMLSWPFMRASNRRNLKQALDRCIEWARQHQVEQVWAILDTPISIELAAPLAAALGVPLRTTVWDDIEHNTRYYALDRLSARRVTDAFAGAMRVARSTAVIGETMQSEYARRYGSEGVIVRHGGRPAAHRTTSVATDDSVRIGFAGSVSARSAFDLLLSTLDRMGWKIEGRPVVLTLMGPRFDLRSDVERRVECLGWRSVEQTIDILSTCSVNYLPQPFEADWDAFSRLSFPSKLTTYLAAGVPVLLHAPERASLPRFFADHPFGACCTSLDTQALETALRRLVSDPDLRRSAIAAGQLAMAGEFTEARFRAAFHRFMDIGSPE